MINLSFPELLEMSRRMCGRLPNSFGESSLKPDLDRCFHARAFVSSIDCKLWEARGGIVHLVRCKSGEISIFS